MIQLLHGDCLELLSTIPDGSVDAVICDLPYGTTDAPWDSVLPLDWLWKQYRRVCKPKSAIVLTARQPFSSVLVASNIKAYRHKWVWDKKQTGNFALAKYMPLQIDEDVLVFGFQSPRYYPQMRTGKPRYKGGAVSSAALWSGIKHGVKKYSDQYYPTNIIPLTNPRLGKLHPTEKPVELMEILIKHYTQADDVVLDNTMGVGSTGVASVNLGRNFIGIERDPTYFSIASERIAAAQQTPQQLLLAS